LEERKVYKKELQRVLDLGEKLTEDVQINKGEPTYYNRFVELEMKKDKINQTYLTSMKE
jgi:hypothetical protein